MFHITESTLKYLAEVTKAFREQLPAQPAPALDQTVTIPEPEILAAFAQLLSMSPTAPYECA